MGETKLATRLWAWRLTQRVPAALLFLLAGAALAACEGRSSPPNACVDGRTSRYRDMREFEYSPLDCAATPTAVPSTRVTALGPEAALPYPPPNSALLLPAETLEVRLRPLEQRILDLPIGSINGDCSNATCRHIFAWSLRSPFPLEDMAFEILDPRMNAYASFGTGPTGEAAKGIYGPIFLVNRTEDVLQIQFRYIIVRLVELE